MADHVSVIADSRSPTAPRVLTPQARMHTHVRTEAHTQTNGAVHACTHALSLSDTDRRVHVHARPARCRWRLCSPAAPYAGSGQAASSTVSPWAPRSLLRALKNHKMCVSSTDTHTCWCTVHTHICAHTYTFAYTHMRKGRSRVSVT